MWELKTLIELIKSIPVIKQVWNSHSSKDIKIEIFPNQAIEEEQIFINRWGRVYGKISHKLSDDSKCTAICITNFGKESVLLDQIMLSVYVKKGVFRKSKIIDEKGEKFKGRFSPEIIPTKDDRKYNFRSKFDSSEKGTLIYEVIAIINNRKIKRVHKEKERG